MSFGLLVQLRYRIDSNTAFFQLIYTGCIPPLLQIM